MSESASCIFCKIIRGEIPSIKVYEDGYTLGFMDVNPASPGHTLVISKTHSADLLDIETGDLQTVTATVQHIARAVNKALTPDGFRIVQANGAAAGQTVFHYHVHIIPKWKGKKTGSHGQETAKPDELKAIAAKISAAL